MTADVWLPSLGQMVGWTVKAVAVAALVAAVAFVILTVTERRWNQ